MPQLANVLLSLQPKTKATLGNLQDTMTAINRSFAIIEFTPDGRILAANENFLAAMGYTLDEIRGKHHSMFVDAAYARTEEYADFWRRLGRGTLDATEYKRFAKGGREVWIQASYNPVMGLDGNTYKVVKFATDITQQKMESADMGGQLSAINKSQAVIEFDLEGRILAANANFLGAVGYAADEIVGRHHSMFVEPEYGRSVEYAEFWRNLKEGKYQAAQYKRFGKGGREIWIEASYNPIMDMNGKPFKVVKYATDITRQRNVMDEVLKNLTQITDQVQVADTQAATAANAARNTAEGVQAVAAGAEEMDASVQEIASSMTKSMNAVHEVMQQVKLADEATQRLDSAANAMGGIVNVIQNIAGQINLLALNATIEAARAGEAGKGFAVVADEVKNLAKQASEATEQISREIGATQAVSAEVVTSLASIKTTTASVEAYVSGTASAVEEQTAVTREISSNMQTASSSMGTISEGMNAIATSVQNVTATVAQTRDAAMALTK